MIGNSGMRPRPRAFSRSMGILGGVVVAATVAALAGGMLVPSAVASVAASGGGWSPPHGLPLPPNFADGGDSDALSCVSRSDCTAVGIYQVPSGTNRFFAVTERRGVWGKALSIATPVATKHIDFEFPVLSCASAGNCAAGGSYGPGAFVVTETNGAWGKPKTVRSDPAAISCPAAGDCTAALNGGFLVRERHGTWHKAFRVPGLAALRHGQPTDFGVISCPSVGNCSAAGSYEDSHFIDRSFVVTERHGSWGSVRSVRSPGGAGLAVAALSCVSAGNCVAGGSDFKLSGEEGAFAVTEKNGTWGTAETLPGTLKLGSGIDQLDCPAAGVCSAAGIFSVGRLSRPFVATEKNGTWHAAQTIVGARRGPDIPSLDRLSCAAAGDCVLAGAIATGSGAVQAGTTEQVKGRWGPASVLPGMRDLDRGQDSAIAALSCPPRSRCTAIGSFGALVTGHLFLTVQR